jgi:hypothetical protein
MRVENQTKKVYAQKPRLNMLFKNSISAAQELPGSLRNFHEFKLTAMHTRISVHNVAVTGPHFQNC